MNFTQKLIQSEQYVTNNPNVLIQVAKDYYLLNNGHYTLHYIQLNDGTFQCDYYKGNIREKSINAKLNTTSAISLS